ncbi:hypothetical protein BBP40_004869 [Aspergillus hancockii]|nr:hypothetical protein BBP40_004869 [Aspergillus hancockii]
MDERPISALQYGHLGKAIYHREIKIWGFSRTLAPSPRISYAGVTKTTIRSPLTAPQSSQIENKSLLPKAYPELAACLPLVHNETLSHVVTTTTEICEPLLSTLFDLGHAVDHGNGDSGSRTIPIAVVASGECGNTISFYKLEEDFVDLRLEATTRIRVPSIKESENAKWSARGAPVRQVCFARTVEAKATWMAARFPHSTMVFRPRYHRKPVSAHIYHDDDWVLPSRPRNSRLDANPLVEISNSQTGGAAHAAVTFNPWYQKQIGIVDERGNWSIWEISGRHKQSKSNWTTVCVKSGTLPWLDPDEGHNIDDHPRHDGWAAIEWAGDVNSFIVSDRRCPMLYRMEGSQVYPYFIELGLKKKSEWILDVKRSTCNVSHVFILTTSRVFWLNISPDRVLNAEEGTRPSLFPGLAWRHFRDPEDLTLQLTPLSIYEDCYLVLYSRLSHVALAFYCPTISDGHEDIHVPDPFLLDIPLMPERNGESQSSLTQFSSLIFREIMHPPSTAGKRDYDLSLKLIKLFVLDSRLSVRESIYVGPWHNGSLDEQVPGNNVIRMKRRYPVMLGEHSHSLWSHDNFVVDDWDESAVGPGTLTIPDTGISSITPLAIPQWIVDYSQVYEVATGRVKITSKGNNNIQAHEKSFHESLKELEYRVLAASGSRSASQTLLETLGRSTLLNDIDQDARDVESLLSKLLRSNSSTQEHCQFVVQLPSHMSLSSRKPVQCLGPSEFDLIDLYDQLVNDWLAALPHNIPGRTRIMKEKSIRSITADLSLARVVAMRRTVYGLEGAAGSDKQSSSQVEDPLLLSAINDSRFSSERRPSLPSATPGDNGWGLPGSSATAQNGRTSKNDGASDMNTGSLYSNLAAFTTFTDERERSMSRNVENVLHHWVPGLGPVAYNWQRTVQALGMEESQRESKLPIPRPRLGKKIAKKFSPTSSAPPPVTSVVPPVRQWGSQPEINEPPIVQLQGSQFVVDGFPMTQVERGAFGGREAGRKSIVKARKKKRAAGF